MEGTDPLKEHWKFLEYHISKTNTGQQLFSVTKFFFSFEKEILAEFSESLHKISCK